MQTSETTLSKRVRELRKGLLDTADPAEHFPLLDELSRQLLMSDPSQAEQVARRLVTLATERENPLWISRGSRAIGNSLAIRGYFTEALKRFEEAWELLNNHDAPKDRARLSADLGRTYFQMGDGKSAVRWLESAVRLARETEDQRVIASILGVAGNIFVNMGLYSSALTMLGQALEQYRELKFDQGTMLVLRDIGQIHANNENWEKALELYEKSAEINRRIGSRQYEAIVLTSMAGVLAVLGEFDRAICMLHTSIAMFEEMEDRLQHFQGLLKLGYVYAMRGELDSAEGLYRMALQRLEGLNNQTAKAQALFKLGSLMFDRGEYEQAERALAEALSMYRKMSNVAGQRIVHKWLGPVYENLNDPSRALEHYKTCHAIEQSMWAGAIQQWLIRVEEGILVEQTKRESFKFESEASRLENENRQRSLATVDLSASLLRSRNSIDDLLRKMKSFRDALETDTNAVEELLVEIDRTIGESQGWQQVEDQIKSLDHDFLSRISSHDVSLTPTEIRICLLLHLGLMNNQVAEVLDISIRTVHTHRTSIRKKFGLEREDNLNAALARL